MTAEQLRAYRDMVEITVEILLSQSQEDLPSELEYLFLGHKLFSSFNALTILDAECRLNTWDRKSQSVERTASRIESEILNSVRY